MFFTSLHRSQAHLCFSPDEEKKKNRWRCNISRSVLSYPHHQHLSLLNEPTGMTSSNLLQKSLSCQSSTYGRSLSHLSRKLRDYWEHSIGCSDRRGIRIFLLSPTACPGKMIWSVRWSQVPAGTRSFPSAVCVCVSPCACSAKAGSQNSVIVPRPLAEPQPCKTSHTAY